MPDNHPHSLALADNLDVKTLGQVFTPDALVDHMLSLKCNSGRVLEPSCGDGAFFKRLRQAGLDCLGVEKDPRVCPEGALTADFFQLPLSEQFESIVGNPPYVRHQDISPDTQALLDHTLFDRRSNLYLYFIHKCVLHLKAGGELIFVTPRDFLKATSARKLNEWLHRQGTFTHMEELGDARVFKNAAPNCVVFRYVKGDLGHRTEDGRTQILAGGQLHFGAGSRELIRLGDVFSIKVGAVSGADRVFEHPEGNRDFVCSHTRDTGHTRRMFYGISAPQLLPHKQRLLQRRIRAFDETNWWEWGRGFPDTARPRIYVNAKTRRKAPFFLHPCTAFDGSVLALFPRYPEESLDGWVDVLNNTDWKALGFECDSRLLFSQRSLQECLIFSGTS